VTVVHRTSLTVHLHRMDRRVELGPRSNVLYECRASRQGLKAFRHGAARSTAWFSVAVCGTSVMFVTDRVAEAALSAQDEAKILRVTCSEHPTSKVLAAPPSRAEHHPRTPLSPPPATQRMTRILRSFPSVVRRDRFEQLRELARAPRGVARARLECRFRRSVTAGGSGGQARCTCLGLVETSATEYRYMPRAHIGR